MPRSQAAEKEPEIELESEKVIESSGTTASSRTARTAASRRCCCRSRRPRSARIYDRGKDETVAAPLAAYLALLHVAGPMRGFDRLLPPGLGQTGSRAPPKACISGPTRAQLRSTGGPAVPAYPAAKGPRAVPALILQSFSSRFAFSDGGPGRSGGPKQRLRVFAAGRRSLGAFRFSKRPPPPRPSDFSSTRFQIMHIGPVHQRAAIPGPEPRIPNSRFPILDSQSGSPQSRSSPSSADVVRCLPTCSRSTTLGERNHLCALTTVGAGKIARRSSSGKVSLRQKSSCVLEVSAIEVLPSVPDQRIPDIIFRTADSGYRIPNSESGHRNPDSVGGPPVDPQPLLLFYIYLSNSSV
jgi:hypothetical protein